MKKLLFSAIAIASALQLSAYTEETETMTVNLADGTKVEYNVADIQQVAFAKNTTTVGFEVISPEGEKTRFSEVPMMFYTAANGTGGSYGLGFGNIAAETPEGLTAGQYAVQLTISASKFNSGEVNIADGGIYVGLLKYNDQGEVETSWINPTEGTVSTRTTKGRMTFELNARYEDGTAVYATYTGSLVTVESLESMAPVPALSNEYKYYNADGLLTTSSKLTSCTRKNVSSRGIKVERFVIANEDEDTDFNITIEINAEMFDDLLGTEIDLPTAARDAVNFSFGYNIQVSSPNSTAGSVATNAKIKITDNGDGTYTLEGNVVNTYKYSWGTDGGNPSRVEFKYTGPVTQL